MFWLPTGDDNRMGRGQVISSGKFFPSVYVRERAGFKARGLYFSLLGTLSKCDTAAYRPIPYADLEC